MISSRGRKITTHDPCRDEGSSCTRTISTEKHEKACRRADPGTSRSRSPWPRAARDLPIERVGQGKNTMKSAAAS